MKSVFLLILLVIPSLQLSAQAPVTAEPLEKTLAALNEQLRIDPKHAAAYQERGCVHFKLGNFKASVGDFDKYLELKPERKGNHWQRGISCYYAGQYNDGRRQFESCQAFDGNDVENAVWHYMCMARTAGVVAARKDMYKMGADRRVPMRQVYELFSGRLKPAEVMAAAQAGKPDPEQLNRRLFYAHLYVGIYCDLDGNAQQALEHLNKAADNYRIDHYMGDVARVHRDLLKKKAVVVGS